MKPFCFVSCHFPHASLFLPVFSTGWALQTSQIWPPIAHWLSDISLKAPYSKMDTMFHLNYYQNRVGLGEFFIVPSLAVFLDIPWGCPSPSSEAWLTHLQLWARTTPSSSFQPGQLESRQSLTIFYLNNWMLFICVWYFHCLFMSSCILQISDNHSCGKLLIFESFLTKLSSYSHIICKCKTHDNVKYCQILHWLFCSWLCVGLLMI